MADVKNPMVAMIAALARAQAKFPKLVKTHDNGAFKGATYADTADVLNTFRPIMAAEGFAHTQLTRTGFTPEGDRYADFVTTLYHEDGGTMESAYPMPTGTTAQQLAGWITYAKRTFYLAAIGAHPEDDDDDGNTANEIQPNRQQPRRASYEPRERHYASEAPADGPQPAMNLPATDKQQGRIVSQLKAAGAAKRDEQVAVLKHLTGYESIKALTKGQASDVIDALVPYEEGKEWGMFVWDNAGTVSVVNVGEEPFELEGHQ